MEMNDKKAIPYEISRHLMDFHLAGFAYYAGIELIDDLTVGSPVTLRPEPDNPHDPEAVAIYYSKDEHEYKLGYIPKAKNFMIFKLLYFGYGNLLDARIQHKNLEEHPEHQFRVVLRLNDNRE